VTAREILDRAAERLDNAGERPEVRGALLDTMGSVYQHLGIYSRADPLLQEALAVRRQSLGDENLDTASSLLHLGELRTDQAR
jgi:serine/threonine-protein kinase